MCRIKNSYPTTVAGHGCGIPSLHTGLLSATRQRERPRANHRGPGRSASLARPLLGSSPPAGRSAAVEGATAVAPSPSGRRPHPDRAGQARPAGAYGGTAMRLRLGRARLARRVGWSPATRPRAVTPGERPEDPPARGDRHRARLGVGQGPQMYLLAEARRPPSVHPADLRLALPGVPHPRPAVLQPWRPAVCGARHRAVGAGAKPAVAGQGGGQAPHRPRTSGP
jgi:hypothetical protein